MDSVEPGLTDLAWYHGSGLDYRQENLDRTSLGQWLGCRNLGLFKLTSAREGQQMRIAVSIEDSRF